MSGAGARIPVQATGSFRITVRKNTKPLLRATNKTAPAESQGGFEIIRRIREKSV
jgi:hypothetical protein